MNKLKLIKSVLEKNLKIAEKELIEKKYTLVVFPEELRNEAGCKMFIETVKYILPLFDTEWVEKEL
jgi:hypothetical protein